MQKENNDWGTRDYAMIAIVFKVLASVTFDLEKLGRLSLRAAVTQILGHFFHGF